MSKRNVRYLRQDQLKGAKGTEKIGILKDKHGDGHDERLLSKPKSPKLDGFQGIQGKGEINFKFPTYVCLIRMSLFIKEEWLL